MDLLYRNSKIGAALVYADAARETLDSTPSTTRTVSITLGDSNGPAANLTNLRVAFHDEASPDQFTTPRYQSASETTSGAAVLSFSCMSSLPIGGTGHITILGAGQVHYNGSVVVS